MPFDWIWKAILIVTFGSLLLRLAGRTSVNKLSITDVLLMLVIGPLLIRPVENQNIWTTFGTAIVLILTVIIFRGLFMQSERIRSVWNGKPIPVIVNGKPEPGAMASLKLTDESLDAQLRAAGIYERSQVEYAAFEGSGKLSVRLKPHMAPATKQDIEQLKHAIMEKHNLT
ncbi:DUF421 domain-containing protein [Paenibacillus montanisoli]|uniref:DUF421 domain-containing protein n=1 Tax=Paenibacillus montanisoli TaxID=2081970 RepID=A0A328U6G7_9BACL|nr:YetF domain-containing protein [Paenibacillus montanisoli]RAP75684.1 DUF421 domain-containing protein [Paenibacillus montanisoli]